MIGLFQQHITLQPSGHSKLLVHHPDLMAAATKEEASPSYHLLSLPKNMITQVLFNQLISKFITSTMLYESIASLCFKMDASLREVDYYLRTSEKV